jgi:hypothetical protein
VLKSNGDGTFAAGVSYAAGAAARSVFAADLDGDNDVDLAVALDGNNVSLLKQRGWDLYTAVSAGTSLRFPRRSDRTVIPVWLFNGCSSCPSD